MAGWHWVRLHFKGEGNAPNRTQVGEKLLQTNWIQASDIYFFIALPNRREFEICFFQGACLQRFVEVFNADVHDNFWKEWALDSAFPNDIKHIIVKFWTGRVADEDIELYLNHFCELLQPVQKLVDQFGTVFGNIR